MNEVVGQLLNTINTFVSIYSQLNILPFLLKNGDSKSVLSRFLKNIFLKNVSNKMSPDNGVNEEKEIFNYKKKKLAINICKITQ